MATGIKSKNSRSKQGSYELSWVDKQDPEEIIQTSTATPIAAFHVSGRTAADNRLYWSENLSALRSLLFDDTVKGQVRLIYIDPPFATGQAFISRDQNHAYEDTMTGSSFLNFLHERLVLLRELLAEDGSIYLHLDQTMIFEAKLIMDEVFGRKNFRNFITRKKCNRKNYTRNQYGNIADHILFYTRSDTYVWNRAYEPWTQASAKREYPCVDSDGRPYKKVPIHAPGIRNGATGEQWRGMSPPTGKHWQYTPQRLDHMEATGGIYWSPTGNPRRKIYLEDSHGISVQDIWTDVKDPHNQNSKITGYPTEKEISLLRRIVEASSNPGDLVLDAFSGSGTTLEAAASAGRRWIGIDASPIAIESTLKRLRVGRAPMGDFVNQHSSEANDPDTKVGKQDVEFTLLSGTVQEKAQARDAKLKQWCQLYTSTFEK